MDPPRRSPRRPAHRLPRTRGDGGSRGGGRHGLEADSTSVAVPHERIRGMVARHRRDPVRASFRATDAAVPVVVPRGDRLGKRGPTGVTVAGTLPTRERDQLRRGAARQLLGPTRPPRPGRWSGRIAAGPRSSGPRNQQWFCGGTPLDRVAGRPSRGGSREPASVRFSRLVAKQRQVARSAAHRPLS